MEFMKATKMKTKTRNPSEKRLAVWRHNYRNPRLVGVEMDDGELLDVKVKDSSLYCENMIFPVGWDGYNFYEQKAPRQRGKV
jgi:hypothetical protein